MYVSLKIISVWKINGHGIKLENKELNTWVTKNT